jgi:SsrA-binding protein
MIENKKAFYDYEILEQIECGMKLESWEVKAIAAKTCSIAGSHCKIIGPDVMLIGASMGTAENDIMRSRKLLLHKKEISRLIGKTQEKGLTLIPLRVYHKNGKFKLAIGIAKGKKEYDKRETNKNRDIDIDNRRIVKSQKLV